MTSATATTFEPTESFAQQLDARDPLREERAGFAIPEHAGGEPVIYLCGNSLGLQPRAARQFVEQEMDDWACLGVDAHFQGKTPWYPYHEVFNETGARLVGGRPGEVVMMNGLTVNLHLLMRTFFRPTTDRYRILIESPAFPSDVYAVKTHLATRGLDPDDALLLAAPRAGEHTIRGEDIEATLAEHGASIALVLLGGVNFFTGQLFDIPRITEVAHRAGCTVGFDLAHAAGNVPLELHDWDVDFAAWCSYKYLNAGPGAIAGCFVHERHATDTSLPRYGGWWGNDPETRFEMLKTDVFVPRATVEGWQLSNPPILAMAPLRASLEIFDRVGMPALRAKSLLLTGYLRYLLERLDQNAFEIITPVDDAAHGCQLSLLIHDEPEARFHRLEQAGVVADIRRPDVIRVAPVPLYNMFHEVWRFARTLGEQVA